jgi:hypothetical protein
MPYERTDESIADAADDAAALLVSAGIIVMALFPLALPAIALTLLLAIPLLAVILVAGLFAAPIILVRRRTRRGARALR